MDAQLVQRVQMHIDEMKDAEVYIERLKSAADILLQYIPKHEANCQCDCCTAAGVMRYTLVHR